MTAKAKKTSKTSKTSKTGPDAAALLALAKVASAALRSGDELPCSPADLERGLDWIRGETRARALPRDEEFRTGMEELRALVAYLDHCREYFLDAFSAEALLRIYRVCCASDLDVFPDDWTENQLAAALAGRLPEEV